MSWALLGAVLIRPFLTVILFGVVVYLIARILHRLIPKGRVRDLLYRRWW